MQYFLATLDLILPQKLSYHRYPTLRRVEYLRSHIPSPHHSVPVVILGTGSGDKPSLSVLLPSLLLVLPVAVIWGEEETCSEAESRCRGFWGTAYTTGTGKCLNCTQLSCCEHTVLVSRAPAPILLRYYVIVQSRDCAIIYSNTEGSSWGMRLQTHSALHIYIYTHTKIHTLTNTSRCT